MTDKEPELKHLITSAEIAATEPYPLKHPFDANCRVDYIPVSEKAGMKRSQLAIGRVAPGQQSFPFHAHAVQEEWLYILGGSGEADIGDETFSVGAGDYMGFPTDGTAHTLRNTGDEDLVYLMGGERSEQEIVTFPGLGKRMMVSNGSMHIADEADLTEISHADFLASDEDADRED